MTEVHLVEYETSAQHLSPQVASALQIHAGGALNVGVGPEPGAYAITAKNYVGSVVLDEVRVLIRPKIPLENLFLLLEVGLPPSAWRKETFEYATSKDLLPSVVSFFARTVDTTLTRGMTHAYVQQRDRLVALRGRVDFPAAMRRPVPASPVPCVFDEFTADNFENRYLRAAIQRALHVAGVPFETRCLLRRNLARLEGVSDVPVEPSDLDRIVLDRLNGHYEPALRLARLLLERMTLLDRPGDTGASAFLVDMNDLYQRFLTARLRRLLRGSMQVVAEPRHYLGWGQQVSMLPDLVFRQDDRDVCVGDIKYKLTADARARNADYYQLLAYCTALDLDEGVLVYCMAEGERPHREVVVRHAGKRLWTYCLDLSGGVKAIEAELARLADWVEARASGDRGRGGDSAVSGWRVGVAAPR